MSTFIIIVFSILCQHGIILVLLFSPFDTNTSTTAGHAGPERGAVASHEKKRKPKKNEKSKTTREAYPLKHSATPCCSAAPLFARTSPACRPLTLFLSHKRTSYLPSLCHSQASSRKPSVNAGSACTRIQRRKTNSVSKYWCTSLTRTPPPLDPTVGPCLES